MPDQILPIMIDNKVGFLSYLKSIFFGRNFEVSEFSHNQNGVQTIVTGSFLLTLSKKSLFIMKDKKPFIAKSWKSVNPDSYYQSKKKDLSHADSNVKAEEVFQDSSSDYWELGRDQEIQHLILKQKSQTAIIILF